LGEVFVDRSVAVVVDPIADFDAGQDLSNTVAPVSACTGLFAVFADAFACGSRRASIASAFLSVSTGRSAAFVGAPIAVVVDVVAACFGCCGSSCLYRASGGGFGCVADLDTRAQTSADAYGAGLSEVGKGFVYAPIAVVVGIVADFGGWGDFADASTISPVGAASGASLTTSDPLCSSGARITSLGETFVDLAVAVVVDAVADFGSDLFGDIFEGLDEGSGSGGEVTFGCAARDSVAVEFGLGDGVAEANGEGFDIVGLRSHFKGAKCGDLGDRASVVGAAVGHQEGVASAGAGGIGGDVLNPVGCGVQHRLTKTRWSRRFGCGELGFDGRDVVVCDGYFENACCTIKHQAKSDVCRELIQKISDSIIPCFVVADRTRLIQHQENICFLISAAVLSACFFSQPEKNDQGQQPRRQNSSDACAKKAKNGSLCTHENSLQMTHETMNGDDKALWMTMQKTNTGETFCREKRQGLQKMLYGSGAAEQKAIRR